MSELDRRDLPLSTLPLPAREVPRQVVVMGPLLIKKRAKAGEPDPMKQFRENLARLADLGVHGVFTDIWWSKVERERRGVYDWTRYDVIAEAIADAGLVWVPGIAFHSCGTNVGDDNRVVIRDWFWNLLDPLCPGAAQFVSEHGNACKEYVSFWATPYVLPIYREFMQAFADRFAWATDFIAEVCIGLGPCGELRYPSYNNHDGKQAAYPSRGALQCYSPAAKVDFQRAMLRKHGSLDKISRAWRRSLSLSDVALPADAETFFTTRQFNTTYGRDLLGWYQGVLLSHARQVLGAAADVFAQEPYNHIPVGVKIAGIHWRVGRKDGAKIIHGRRRAEMVAGLIVPSDDINQGDKGWGYRPVIDVFAELNRRHPTIVHFTCGDLPDLECPQQHSLADSLTRWFCGECTEQGLPIGLENALAESLSDPSRLHRLGDHFFDQDARRMTILRLNQLLEAPEAVEWVQTLVADAAAHTSKRGSSVATG